MGRLRHRIAKELLSKGRLGRLAFKIGKKQWHFACRIVGMLVWPFPAFGTLWRWTSTNEKRVLAIWDTRAQPYAIGDMLVFLEGTLVVREIHKAAKIDICVLSDEHDYKLPSPDLNEITTDNRL